MRLPRSMGKAHRVAYEVWVGPIPKGHVVRHTCDNPPCINPAHLVSGTNAENSRDMVDRGRSLVGERHHKARLTEDDVRKIRAMQGTNKEIANAVGSTEHTVQDVRSGRSWKHIA